MLVVGNVVAGGSGKTPVVIALVQRLRANGLAVGVISRGYGRSPRDVREVHADSSANAVGDEPVLIQRRCSVPVFVAASRVRAAQALLAAHPQTQLIVSDDGLQHAALARDLELGVFDDRGLGNGWMLPAGPLREPWPRRLDACLQTRAGLPCAQGFVLQRHLGTRALRADGQTLALATLAQHATPCVALAGIAQPEPFFAALRACGVVLQHTLALADHARLDDLDLSAWANQPILCTEKDAVKLWLRHPDAWAVPLHCTLPEAFWRWLGLRLAALGLPAIDLTREPPSA